jgi:signal transduction histidine kinase
MHSLVMGAEGGMMERPERVSGEPGEHGLQALVLACAARGMAHAVRNPLNAIGLQAALLADKIGAEPRLAEACAPQLARLREHVARIDEELRRFLGVAERERGDGWDAAALLADAARLFGHEARRRRVSLEVGAAGGGSRVAGDGARAARAFLGLVWRALAESGEGGRVVLRCQVAAGEVLLGVEHAPSARGVAPPWVEVAAAAAASALGGRLEAEAGERCRAVLRLPAEGA